jgi:hypothetical protein
MTIPSDGECQPARPMPRADIERKFRGNVGKRLPGERSCRAAAASALQGLWDLDHATDVSTLMNRRGVHSVGMGALQNQREIAVAQYLSLNSSPQCTKQGLRNPGNSLIDEVLGLIQEELESHGISVRRELIDGLPAAVGERVQLQQALLNLVMNAIDAMSAVTGGDSRHDHRWRRPPLPQASAPSRQPRGPMVVPMDAPLHESADRLFSVNA